MKQKRSYGQVFLKDQRLIKLIVDNVVLGADTVVEIGSGNGVISTYIADRVRQLYCLEADKRFARLLDEKFIDKDNVTVYNINALKFKLNDFSKKITIFGNIPYHFSKEIVAYIVSNRKFILILIFIIYYLAKPQRIQRF